MVMKMKWYNVSCNANQITAPRAVLWVIMSNGRGRPLFKTHASWTSLKCDFTSPPGSHIKARRNCQKRKPNITNLSKDLSFNFLIRVNLRF